MRWCLKIWRSSISALKLQKKLTVSIVVKHKFKKFSISFTILKRLDNKAKDDSHAETLLLEQ